MMRKMSQLADNLKTGRDKKGEGEGEGERKEKGRNICHRQQKRLNGRGRVIHVLDYSERQSGNMDTMTMTSFWGSTMYMYPGKLYKVAAGTYTYSGVCRNPRQGFRRAVPEIFGRPRPLAFKHYSHVVSRASICALCAARNIQWFSPTPFQTKRGFPGKEETTQVRA